MIKYKALFLIKYIISPPTIVLTLQYTLQTKYRNAHIFVHLSHQIPIFLKAFF